MRAWAVQISDLHIGDQIKGGGLIPKATAHDLGALRALGNFFIRFHSLHRKEPTALIVSGDVSANGGVGELALYRTLVERGFALDRWDAIERFREHFDALLDVPGNHDFWNGLMLPNPNLNLAMRQHHFPGMPWSIDLPLQQHRVVFHGLCSSSGCTPGQQLLAFGAFTANDLGVAARSVRAQSLTRLPRPFHLLVLHHSPAEQSPLSHSLVPSARVELELLCNGAGDPLHKIQGLLTGHRHSCLLVPAAHPQGVSPALPPEVRCGSTLQAPAPLMTQPLALYVHEFEESASGQLGWYATPWDFNGMRFVEGHRERVV